ncbi:conserved hypothetical protein [Theileria orientalis strain Shintoku]|uniref:Uncharacterized protein n=1 Tax=Theileria orientalis strain Shintoku TaxID=869250 RepID=J4DAB4_THEOR|nr:conserved hypothetical protein [Theileria orientalis strain Shintoku]PVC52897.1 hypothetical protein MACL_00000453 [Theileria orientalis]BAM41865.1 conserved hypothetical protein [Theileria orientalis strain Shintoku]|eukprot:XP_009692166.1 conserved hypothetical protein [Theileria orientalis strain Shintoku]
MKPLSPKKFKIIGTIAHSIGLVLSIMIFVFGIYVAVSNDRVISIIVLDCFGGITGFIFSVIGIIAVLKENTTFLLLTRNVFSVTAFFSAVYTLAHGLMPFYHDFYEDEYDLKNMYYLASGGFFLLIIESLYSVYIAHSLYKAYLQASDETKDVETPKEKMSLESLMKLQSYQTPI